MRCGSTAVSSASRSPSGYHHPIGLNTWESRGGSPPPHGTTGLYHTAILYPKAAVFGFCVAVAALRSVHGEEKVREEVSGYYMALECAMVYAGMMIALPAESWEKFGRMS